MSEPTQIVEFSPERIGYLPGWSIVAFAARNAARVLPAYLPTDESPGRRANKLRAASSCCSTAIHAARGAGSGFVTHVEAAAAALSGELPVDADAARACIVSAGRATAANSVEAMLRLAIDGFDGYRQVALHHDQLAAFDAAAVEDLLELERLKLGPPGQRGAQVPAEFFARPLYRPLTTFPHGWTGVVEKWIGALDYHQVERVRDFYSGMCAGELIDEGTLTMVIEVWKGQESADDDQRAPARPHPNRRPPPTPISKTPLVQPFEAPVRPPDEWMLSDRPIDKDFAAHDRFNFQDYAVALAAILDHEKTSTPFTMSINAPWGAGKTTLAKMILAELKQRREAVGLPAHIVCEFNAWMHDDASNVATAFVANIGRTINQHRSWPERFAFPLPRALREPHVQKWRGWLLASALFVAVVMGLVLISGHLEHVEIRKTFQAGRPYQVTETTTTDAAGRFMTRSTSETESRSRQPGAAQDPGGPEDFADWFLGKVHARVALLGTFLTALAGITGLLSWLLVKLYTSSSLGGYVEAPKKAADTGAVSSAGEQLGKLIKHATKDGKRLLVFVDDIERCRPPHSIDVLDAVNQLLNHPNVIVVLLGDMSTVAAAAQLKFKALSKMLAPRTGIALPKTETFGHLYLQKIIQFQFDLPVSSRKRFQSFVEYLASGELAASPSSPGAKISPEVAKRASHQVAEAFRQIQKTDRNLANISVADVAARIPGGTNVTSDHFARLVEQNRQRLLIDDDSFRQEVSKLALDYLQPLPRTGKRFLNRLRVSVLIAQRRGVMTSEPRATIAQIGKWLVLTERWPQLGRALGANPRMIHSLEEDSAPATAAAFSTSLSRLAPFYDHDDDLRAFIYSQPRLGMVLERLVEFGAAPAPALSEAEPA